MRIYVFVLLSWVDQVWPHYVVACQSRSERQPLHVLVLGVCVYQKCVQVFSPGPQLFLCVDKKHAHLRLKRCVIFIIFP